MAVLYLLADFAAAASVSCKRSAASERSRAMALLPAAWACGGDERKWVTVNAGDSDRLWTLAQVPFVQEQE